MDEMSFAPHSRTRGSMDRALPDDKGHTLGSCRARGVPEERGFADAALDDFVMETSCQAGPFSLRFPCCQDRIPPQF
jgi:hypothetical protein